MALLASGSGLAWKPAVQPVNIIQGVEKPMVESPGGVARHKHRKRGGLRKKAAAAAAAEEADPFIFG